MARVWSAHILRWRSVINKKSTPVPYSWRKVLSLRLESTSWCWRKASRWTSTLNLTCGLLSDHICQADGIATLNVVLLRLFTLTISNFVQLRRSQTTQFVLLIRYLVLAGENCFSFIRMNRKAGLVFSSASLRQKSPLLPNFPDCYFRGQLKKDRAFALIFILQSLSPNQTPSPFLKP